MTQLPDGYAVRSVRIDDLDAAVDIINRSSTADIGEGDMTTSRQQAFWLEPERDLTQDNWIVESPDGRIVAYADFNEYAPFNVNEFDYAVDPEHRGQGIEEALFTIAEERARRSIPKAPYGTIVKLETSVWSSNQDDAERLSAHGFTLSRVWNRMLIEMNEIPPEPRWPDGISVRQFEPDELLDVHQAWEDAQRDEWGFSSLTPEEFRYYFIEQEREFDPSLWFLAIDDTSGAIAGYTLCRWERPGEPDTGHIRYLAVRRPYRRRGIGQALLLHSFRAFYRRGKRKVGLAVDSTSLTGADRLYERAGMRPTHQTLVMEKVLRPPIPDPESCACRARKET